MPGRPAVMATSAAVVGSSTPSLRSISRSVFAGLVLRFAGGLPHLVIGIVAGAAEGLDRPPPFFSQLAQHHDRMHADLGFGMVRGGTSQRSDNRVQAAIADRPPPGDAVKGLDHRPPDLPVRLFGQRFGQRANDFVGRFSQVGQGAGNGVRTGDCCRAGL